MSSVSEKEVNPPGPALHAPELEGPEVDLGGTPEFDDSPEMFQELLNLEKESAALEAVSNIPPVKWAADADQPDYAHALAADGAGLDIRREFDFDLNVFKLLVKANRFNPRGSGANIIFGLRGGKLVGEHAQENVTSITIRDERPDHENFLCTLGVINLETGKINAFRGSTVPNKTYMRNYYKIIHNISPRTATRANILPTGCYVYRVGAHKHGSIKPAMRMCDPDNISQDGPCTVLRTSKDLSYSHDDFWDNAMPFDNIHCAYFDDKFSSAGCQTIMGANGKGPWGKFQKIIGAHGQGARLDYVLLTGREAAIARAIIDAGQEDDEALIRTCLERLRVGSEGEVVSDLQKKLGFNGTAYFGPLTKERLTQREADGNLPSDGLYSPTDDSKLGWGVFPAGASGAGSA